MDIKSNDNRGFLRGVRKDRERILTAKGAKGDAGKAPVSNNKADSEGQDDSDSVVPRPHVFDHMA